MEIAALRRYWEAEEQKARIIGWNFDYIADRYESDEDALPWNLTEVINRYRGSGDRLLDIDTGGGEFLLSLGHPDKLTCATEGYPPNVALCREKFAERGIEFHAMTDYAHMPFPDGRFDIIINRHGSYDPKELYRVLRPGGVFVTQQVGEENDRELVKMLLPDAEKPFPGANLTNYARELEQAGFSVAEQYEAFRGIRFYDTGALVWFAKIIEWEFTGFSVARCFDRLVEIERTIRQNGFAEGRIHRFCLAARK
ncbi:MAG: methyltransferase domain-containing protein [Oscillospiraceae bacterium]|nr:methyltransferase domain-containing protein [Oscillospiraceae bacterium]